MERGKIEHRKVEGKRYREREKRRKIEIENIERRRSGYRNKKGVESREGESERERQRGIECE